MPARARVTVIIFFLILSLYLGAFLKRFIAVTLGVSFAFPVLFHAVG